MSIENLDDRLRQFLRDSSFMARGGIVTDLDGTVVQEEQGKAHIPISIADALKELYDLGRPLILNTLRFPLSVIRTFGREWYALSKNPIPLIALNGSQTGFVTMKDSQFVFEELDAILLAPSEIDEILAGVKGLLDAGVQDLLIFAYPRDWRIGEVIWTPAPEKISSVREKYSSASAVTAVEFEKLRHQLHGEEICMIFLLISSISDTLMAYQHTKRSNFFTHDGIDKLSGARRLATRLNIELAHSLGAGDTEMDQFLKGVGFAALVGEGAYQFSGLLQTVRLKNVPELAELLFRLATIQQELAQ
jgi:hydroxymethylpyrimidine pyrophosphatase-like HAD family hydrolase